MFFLSQYYSRITGYGKTLMRVQSSSTYPFLFIIESFTLSKLCHQVSQNVEFKDSYNPVLNFLAPAGAAAQTICHCIQWASASCQESPLEKPQVEAILPAQTCVTLFWAFQHNIDFRLWQTRAPPVPPPSVLFSSGSPSLFHLSPPH